MLKEHFFLIINDNNTYMDFTNSLRQQYFSVDVFYETASLIKSIEFFTQNQAYMDNNIFIVLSEYEFLQDISQYLTSNLDITNYVLISLTSGMGSSNTDNSNLYDEINPNNISFDIKPFNEKLRSEISSKNRAAALKVEMREFYEIGKYLSSEKDTLKLFEIIAYSCMKMTSSDAVTVFTVYDKASKQYSYIENSDYENKLLKFSISKNMSIKIDLEANALMPITKKSLAGYTAVTGKSLRLDDAYKISPVMEYQHNKDFDNHTGFITKSILSVPMKDHRNRITGVIQLLNKKINKNMIIDYTDDAALSNIISYDYNDELIMNSVAGQAAVALENNMLYIEMEELLNKYKRQNEKLIQLSNKVLKAHEEERKRIAREIHDGPAQSAACLALKLELCKRHLQRNDIPNLEKELDNLGNDIRSNVKEIRTIIYDLKPSYLEDGLISAIKSHIDTFSSNNAIEIEFNFNGNDEKIEYYMVTSLYRIVQEALTNCQKHARASKITIDLTITHEQLHLSIVDNGKGFDTINIKNKVINRLEGGFGLEGMQERVELIKGKLLLKSKVNQGTSINITVPLQ